MSNHDNPFDASRRNLIRQGLLAGVGAFAAGALLRAQPARAEKAGKAAMLYQDTPHGTQTCLNCIQYVPGTTPDAPGTCKVVEGSVSPKGWCVAYTPKS